MAAAQGSMRYIFDVRSEGEYAAGHVPGSLNLPGGQAVQRADDFAAVRNAPIVFVSNESARAVMAAYWYRQMGYPKIAVLQGGLSGWVANGGRVEMGARETEPLGFESAIQSVRWIDPPTVKQNIENGAAAILDVGTSVEFEAAHVPGACWISRGWLELKLPEHFADHDQAIILTCSDGRQSVFAAAALKEMGYKNASVLAGGLRAWQSAGFASVESIDGCLTERNDVVLSPSIRGSKEDMRRYLDWELTLQK
jgi:rhodanese-related sulfurtransferase